jgi:sulfofructose kinase
MVATALVAAQRLGASTEFWGASATMNPGMRSEGIEVFQCEYFTSSHCSGRKDGRLFCDGEGRQRRKGFRRQRAEGSLCRPQESALGSNSLKVVLIDATWIEAAQQVAHCARSHGVPVVVDVHDPSQPSLDLLSLADYAIIPKHLAEVLTAKGDYARALHDLKTRGTKVPIITLGEGCTYLYQEKVFKLPAFRVKAVDTTGAGDCFHGAFCFALSRGFALPEAVGLASAVAAISCTKLGGRAAFHPRSNPQLHARTGCQGEGAVKVPLRWGSQAVAMVCCAASFPRKRESRPLFRRQRPLASRKRDWIRFRGNEGV